MSDHAGDVVVECGEHGYTGRTRCPWCEIQSLTKIIINRNRDLRERDEKIEALRNSRFELLDQISALSGEEDFHVVTGKEMDKLKRDAKKLVADLEGVTPFINAAVAWWASKRPLGWTVEEHIANPWVNCVTPVERHLALMICELQGGGLR